jgi:hypothetical protein
MANGLTIGVDSGNVFVQEQYIHLTQRIGRLGRRTRFSQQVPDEDDGGTAAMNDASRYPSFKFESDMAREEEKLYAIATRAKLRELGRDLWDIAIRSL